ncbi:MAG: hypothetical protein WAZ18_06590 [Alphaproteobacteria bacterium]
MKYVMIALLAAASTAVAYDFSAIQNAVMNNPTVQQEVGKRVIQNTAASVPTTKAGVISALGSLTPEQRAQLMTQANAIAAKLFTPAEAKAVKGFQATPAGQGVMSKLPALAEQLAPVILQMYAGK